MSELTLEISRTLNAPIESVFNAWLDPQMLARFMIPGQGMTVPQAHTDPVTGGRFSILMQSGDKQIPHSGEYLKIEPYTQLIFTWESPFSMSGSTVTLDLSPAEEGTLLKLTHVKFPDEQSRSNHEGGWTSILRELHTVLSPTLQQV